MFRKAFPDTGGLLPLLAEIGFKGVEIWKRNEGFDSLCQAAAREGLQLCAMIGSDKPLNDTQAHADAEAELRESIAIAADRGISGLICFGGKRREGLSEEEAASNIAALLCRVAAEAEEKGVTLLMELLNSRIDHPGYQADRTAFGVGVCRRVGSPRVRLLYDIYHMQIMEGDVIRTLQQEMEWIGHLHTAGNPGRHELDDRQELNYGAIARAVSALGFDGFVGHEFAPTGDPVAALRQAYALWSVCHETTQPVRSVAT